MSYYISNPVVDLTDKFILSFNVDFTQTPGEAICYGVDTISRRGTTIARVDHFLNKINRGVIIDNGTSLLALSSQYESDGTYVWNKNGENNILGLELKVWKDKVYEEVKDISSFDPETDLDIFADSNKLYKYVPGRYVIEDGVIKLVFSSIKVTTIFSFEQASIIREEYHVTDHLQDFANKLRLIITNEGSTFSIHKLVDESYELVGTYFFSGRNTGARVYLGAESVNPTNFSVTYSPGTAEVDERGFVLTISTPTPNYKVNLGYNLGTWTQDGYGSEVAVAGKINWGDGSAEASFTGSEGSTESGSNPLIHTFQEVGDYEIEISGICRWNGFTSENQQDSIQDCLTEVFVSEGDNYPIHAISSGCFAYCKHLGNIPAGLFDYSTDITDVSNSFIGCESLSEIPEDLFYYCSSVSNFSNCFSGCTGISMDVPNFWEDFSDATGTDCYKNCVSAQDYYSIPYEWGGPFNSEWGGLQLTFTTTKPNQTVDLGHILGSHSGVEEVCGGIIDWKDGSILTEFGNGDGVEDSKFSHTYATPGRHTIIIGGKIKWGDGVWPFEENDLRKLLSNVSLYHSDHSPIYDIGKYAFAGSKLSSIPGNIFENCTEVTDFTGCFQDCKNLRTVPNELFSDCTSATTFDHAFSGCTSLDSVPGDLFRENTGVTSFDSTFMGSGLDSIPHDLFSTNDKVTNFGDCFRDCMEVESIPEDLFDNCPDVTDFSGTFRHTGISEIPAGLFDNNEKVETFQHCFSDCPNLRTIPEGLFDHCPEVLDFSYTFHNDPNLENIPEDLFKNNTKVQDFSHCFDGDTGLKSDIPELWADFDNEDVKTEGCFDGCENAPNWWNIPESWGGPHKAIDADDPAMVLHIVTTEDNQEVDLGPILGGHSDNEAITNGIFSWDYAHNSDLLGFRPNEGVTNKIFKHTYEEPGEYQIVLSGNLLWSDSRAVNKIADNDVRNFLKSITIEGEHTSPIYDLGTGAFANASKLTTLPGSIFDNCTEITDFSNTFAGCSSLTSIPTGIFAHCTAATNFSNCFAGCTGLTDIISGLFTACTHADNFTSCFENCTGIHSAVPDYWYSYRQATGTDCFEGCDEASNYFDVPEEWGGPEKQITSEALTLKIHTNNSNELVDLGYCLDGSSTWDGVNGGVIDWGDGDYKVGFHNGEGSTSTRLQHTYANSGDHTITISGKFKWGNGHSTLTTHDVRKVLTEVNVPDGKTSPIYELGSYGFYGASNLTSISDKIFSTCKKVAFTGTFEDCTTLATVPTTLLTNCKATIENVSRIFKGCRALQHIPATFFNGKSSLTNASYAFYYSGLTEIPDGLFSTCTWLDDVSYCFCVCEIEEIPSTLFDHCTHLANCSHCFCESDNNLTSTRHIRSIPEDLFDDQVNTEIENLTECFEGCSEVTGNVPELWKTYDESENHSNCFVGCEQCENWYDIPETWGGPNIYAGTGYESGKMTLKVTTDSTNNTIDLSDYLRDSAITITGGIKEYILPATIDWGDGTTVELGSKLTSSTQLSHTYSGAGSHEISITGNIKWSNKYTDPDSIEENNLAKHLTEITLDNGTKSPISDITSAGFNGFSKLTKIPANLFEQCAKVVDISRTFENCTALTAIPEGIFSPCTKVTTLWSCFYNCTSLTEIPAKLLEKLTALEDVAGLFHNCSQIANIPTGLFSANTKIKNAQGTFANTGLTSITEDPFTSCTALVNCEATFSNCNSLTSVPDTIFDRCTAIKTLALCFSQDSALTSLPKLWENHGDASVIETGCFMGCKNTATNFNDAAVKGWCHPVNDARHLNLKVKTNSANQIINLAQYLNTSGNRGHIDWGDGTTNYTGNSHTTGSPVAPTAWGRFSGTEGTSESNNPMVHTFQNTGEHTIKIGGNFSWKKSTGTHNINTLTTKIATDSNKGCPITSIDSAAFSGWTALTTIPANLFNNCPSMTSFASMFDGCTALTAIPSTLFSKHTNATNFDYCFRNCKAVSGALPTLWTTHIKVTSAKQCFCGCTKASNYDACLSACTTWNDPQNEIAGWGCLRPETFTNKNYMILNVKIATANSTVNLGYNLGRWRSSYNTSTTAVSGILDWGDGSASVTFNGNEGTETSSNKLVHQFTKPGNYAIRVGGSVKWSQTTTSAADSIAKYLTAIYIPAGKQSPVFTFGTYAFSNNSLLTSVPSTLFNNAINMTHFTGCFQRTAITSIPGDIFAKNTKAVSFEACFANSKLKAIPTGLFDKNTAITDLYTCFQLSAITSVSAAMFKNLSKLTDLTAMFNGTKITSIPSGLFDQCPNVGNITTIRGIFNNTLITSIPANLFSKFTKLNDYTETFKNCANLKTIPSSLFGTNTPFHFDKMFQNCTALTAIPDILSKVPNTSSTSPEGQGNDRVLYVQNMFNGCTNVSGNLPTWWTKYTGNYKFVTDCFTGCTKASNLAAAKSAGWAT